MINSSLSFITLNQATLTTNEKAFLADFKKEISFPITDHKALTKARSLIEALEKNDPFLAEDNIIQAIHLREIFAHPKASSGRINVIALATLRQEMQKLVLERLNQINTISYFDHLLSFIPKYQQATFLDVINNGSVTCDTKDAKTGKELATRRLSFALACASTPLANIKKGLEDWKCPISHEYILEPNKARAYLTRAGVPHNTLYDEEHLRKWVKNHKTCPMTRTPVTEFDIAQAIDHPKLQEGRKVACSLLYFETTNEAESRDIATASVCSNGKRKATEQLDKDVKKRKNEPEEINTDTETAIKTTPDLATLLAAIIIFPAIQPLRTDPSIKSLEKKQQAADFIYEFLMQFSPLLKDTVYTEKEHILLYQQQAFLLAEETTISHNSVFYCLTNPPASPLIPLARLMQVIVTRAAHQKNPLFSDYVLAIEVLTLFTRDVEKSTFPKNHKITIFNKGLRTLFTPEFKKEWDNKASSSSSTASNPPAKEMATLLLELASSHDLLKPRKNIEPSIIATINETFF